MPGSVLRSRDTYPTLPHPISSGKMEVSALPRIRVLTGTNVLVK